MNAQRACKLDKVQLGQIVMSNRYGLTKIQESLIISCLLFVEFLSFFVCACITLP